MRKIKISGYGTYLPHNYVKFGDQKRYRISENETQLSMGIKAALNALENANMKASDIDLIIAANAVGIQAIPCTAALYHEQLFKGMSIPAMDINTTCSSFISALDLISYAIDNYRYKNVLIISSEIASLALNPNHKESFELFSDGAAAMIISRSEVEEDKGIIYSVQKTWSEGAHYTELKAGGTGIPPQEFKKYDESIFHFYMAGLRVLSLAAKKIPEIFNDIEKKGGINLDKIDIIVPHQASKSLDSIMKRLRIPKEKYVNIVREYGNMVSASVPFALCKSIENGNIKKGSKVMLLGTAAGLTINALILKY